ncbi:hypothetical protein JL2886_02157 [Phaeobacter gallaeciensis]|uniref:Uncharacterized protein n=1 Tax=Phaeobacter gallaeciensis TaxID=60890 RepID=A0A1B0ZSK1_9RHOB|nr:MULTISPECIES: hypothetical protein [Phaeobacter]ANP37048.1 hypothetical protein JL2886_02157 [Phaeobacter gallaeciensis]PVZ46393.1 hypothetical protein DD556_12435 [Phaeobacter sp. JL2872]
MDEKQLRDFLVERVNAHWQTPKKLLLLADVPSELKEHKDLDYKDILGDKRLKSFAEEMQGDGGFKLIQHPSQKAKLALVPFDADYEFPEVSLDAGGGKRRGDLPGNHRKVTLDFLSIVKSLPEKDQSEIIIPARIIAKLISD